MKTLSYHRLCATMTLKSLLKFAMERGETVILLSLFEADVWALYSIVQNLGSLVVRLVLFPVEDMAQLLFSKLCSDGRKDEAGRSLSMVLSLVGLIGCFSAAFGPGYAYSVIHILYGQKWSETEMPSVLSWYSWCIPLMAANGVTEAFLHASASPRQIAERSAMLLPTTAANLALSFALAPR
jgi:oligosaccharide translocation protein RFT1